MDASAKSALAAIRRCIRDDRLRFTAHFLQRMDERGLVWPDLLSVFQSPSEVRPQHHDPYGRPKWAISGEASDGAHAAIICVLDTDDSGSMTILVTMFFENG